MKLAIEKQRIIDYMTIEITKVDEQKQKETMVIHQKEASTKATDVEKKSWSGVAKATVIEARVGNITGAAVTKKKNKEL